MTFSFKESFWTNEQSFQFFLRIFGYPLQRGRSTTAISVLQIWDHRFGRTSYKKKGSAKQFMYCKRLAICKMTVQYLFVGEKLSSKCAKAIFGNIFPDDGWASSKPPGFIDPKSWCQDSRCARTNGFLNTPLPCPALWPPLPIIGVTYYRASEISLGKSRVYECTLNEWNEWWYSYTTTTITWYVTV